ncbi:MAG: hypothetical protein Q4C13_07660, partial [Clostridia bacterium]|nr:hypothetical protein [Clostridia bacterium]
RRSLFYVCVENITDRMELDVARRRMEAIINNVPAGVAIFRVNSDNGDCVPVYMSERGAELLGYARPEAEALISRGEAVPISDAEREGLLACLREDGAARLLRARRSVMTSGGERRWLRVLASIALPEDDGLRRMYTAIFDDTERLAAEERLSRRLEEYGLLLRHSGKSFALYDVAERSLSR